jgi:formylglycine-generating enzyme required for sulfatase activity
MALIEGGEFLMGNAGAYAYPDDGEGPVRRVRLDAFWIDRCATPNTEFARFVEATGYLLGAERFGWSFVFGGLLRDDFRPTRGVAGTPWWRRVEEADWRRPEGPPIEPRDQLPDAGLGRARPLPHPRHQRRQVHPARAPTPQAQEIPGQ